jgi:hypothetical protein
VGAGLTPMRPGKSDEREDVVLGVLDDSRDLRVLELTVGATLWNRMTCPVSS